MSVSAMGSWRAMNYSSHTTTLACHKTTQCQTYSSCWVKLIGFTPKRDSDRIKLAKDQVLLFQVNE